MKQAESASSSGLLENHFFYKACSDSSKLLLLDKGRFVEFSPGKQIIGSSHIPNSFFLVLSGEIRLLDKSSSRLSTISKQGSGSAPGLYSILRGIPFEEVLASTTVVAFQVDDSLLLELFLSDADLMSAFDLPYYPEIYHIVQQISSSLPISTISLKERSEHVYARASCVQARSSSEFKKLFQDADIHGDLLLLSSFVSGNTPIGTRLKESFSFSNVPGPLYILRMIRISSDVYAQYLTASCDTETLTDNSTHLLSDTLKQHLHTGEAPGKSGIIGNPNKYKPSKLIRGVTRKEQILACFTMLGQMLQFPVRRDSIEQLIDDCEERGLSLDLYFCAHQASICGLHVVTSDIPIHSLLRVITPSLIEWNGSICILYKSDSSGIGIASPLEGFVNIDPRELQSLSNLTSVRILSLEKTNRTPRQQFNINWLWPAVARYKSVLLQVLVASFVVQLFSLANPMLIQVIIDKVISQRSTDTLQVLGISLIVVTIFEAVIGGLRTFLFSDATNRIDLRLGSEVIDHLLRLPLTFFDTRPVGELSTRVSELEKIRNFLTGQALTTVLDAAFSVIYIIVMFCYSWLLTLMALAVLPIQVVLTLLGAPLYRKLTRSAAEENAKTQSQLVEVLTNIQTIKAQNVETISRWKWHEYYASYISKSFDKTVTVSVLSEVSQALQKLSQLLVLWVGASMVLQGDLTLGQLIAFRIIAGYVTQPLLRLSTIWQNIQELRVSFERLADVVDAVSESSDIDKQNISLPPVKGDIRFENVSFRFDGLARDVLNGINLHIEPGQFVGIVGQSGSGKSTLTKLISRLYTPRSGSVKLDGYDIAKVELNSLRRQIGIVPQEPLLFSGSISENISLTNPEANNDQIISSATIACAHDFIMLQPNGYASKVGERGSTLSGGQRQRLAIARTLLSKPKLLIMDEATSALDYATEAKLCSNLINSLEHTTTLFITHRLSTVRRADLIIMMHDGSVAESGTHDELMSLRGRYFALYTQQDNS